MNDKLKNIPDVDFIFFSARDHVSGTKNHGLLQMFEFFTNNLDKKSIFVNTQHSVFSNDVDIFDLSRLGGHLPLAHQINTTMVNSNDPRSWHTLYGIENHKIIAINTLIKNLPNHKCIVIADKAEVDFHILARVMEHFKSKLLIISAVNNTWTGLCAYPKEFNCDKFKTVDGCTSDCPAIKPNSGHGQKFVSYNYRTTVAFVKSNPNLVFLNVGNKFSFDEANESYAFNDIQKALIPLKTVAADDSFEVVWERKKHNKKQILDLLESKYGIVGVDYVLMWSADNLGMKRKGMNYFIESLHNLKNKIGDDFKNLCLIICAGKSDLYNEKLDELGIKYAKVGFLTRESYNKVASAADLYCSTTISDAGPRTTFEAAAQATPIISFDFCNAADFVNETNGALVETYNTKMFSQELERLISEKDKAKQYSEQIYKTYNEFMDTDRLVQKWNTFFDKTLKI